MQKKADMKGFPMNLQNSPYEKGDSKKRLDWDSNPGYENTQRDGTSESHVLTN